MTIEFPDEQVDRPRVRERVQLRPALPWLVPLTLAVAALFLPVTSADIAAESGAVGGFSRAFRIDAYPFGTVRLSNGPSPTVAVAAQYGWVWLAVAVVLAAAAVGSAVRPGTPWPGVAGAVAGALGMGSLGMLSADLAAPASSRTTGAGLAPGSWLLLAASVLGLALGLVAIRQASRSARANADG